LWKKRPTGCAGTANTPGIRGSGPHTDETAQFSPLILQSPPYKTPSSIVYTIMRTDNILLAASAAVLLAALILIVASFFLLEIGTPNLSSLFAVP
jgi:hypothetical protein